MNKMIIVTPEEINNIDANKLDAKSVFLAGTIDNGESFNWQEKVINKLSEKNLSLEIFNPRRKNWNENSSKEEIEKQIKWEQKHLDMADLIIMVLLDNSKSPISLLELGLYANSKKIIVFCSDKFYRYDNVRLTCEKYNIELDNNLNIDNIVKKIFVNT